MTGGDSGISSLHELKWYSGETNINDVFFLFGTTGPTTGGVVVFSNIYLHTKGSIGTHVAEKYCEES